MRIARTGLAVALLAAVPLAVFAAGETGTKGAPITAGDFAVMLAKATGTKGPIDARAASAQLSTAGVPIGDYRHTLSEKELTAILDYYGVQATTTSPDRGVSAAKAQTALSLLSGSLAGAALSTSAVRPSPQSLDDCLALANHGQCTNCCKALNGAPNACAKQCFAINKPSAGEPLP